MTCLRQVNAKTAFFGVACLLLSLVAGLVPVRAEETAPNARDLLAQVRANQASQNRDLSGKLRKSTSEEKIVIPFQLLLRGNTIIYQFTDRPESLILRLGDKGSRLDHATGTNGKIDKITGAKLDDLIRGTDISYEDLALKFLYWTNAIVEPRKETLMTRSCWIVRAVPSRKDESQYDMARLWIEPTGGLLQAECYAGGKLVRRFSVRNVQRDQDTGSGYILKSMSIQRLDAQGKGTPPTYLEVRQD